MAARSTDYQRQLPSCMLLCMQLTDEGIREFQRLWREDYGEDISGDAARKHLSELVELYSLLLKHKRGTDVRQPRDHP